MGKWKSDKDKAKVEFRQRDRKNETEPVMPGLCVSSGLGKIAFHGTPSQVLGHSEDRGIEAGRQRLDCKANMTNFFREEEKQLR